MNAPAKNTSDCRSAGGLPAQTAGTSTAARGESASASLAQRLRGVRVGVRADLECSRHVFRGEAAYVLRDPINFRTHQVSQAEYSILVRIDPQQALGSLFERLVARGQLTAAQEEEFYHFIGSLHAAGLLNLPLADDASLYRRLQNRRAASLRATLLGGFLFWQIPLWNPDSFLARTRFIGQLLFSRAALAAWIVLLLSAAWVALGRWQDLLTPINGLLAGSNLPLIWTALVILKVIHEFGHAYACKHFGGHVPEMGLTLILFTPCAYVDASASWGFPRKSLRAIVCLAGMYFESFVAATAVLVWAFSDPGLLNSIAYNVIFLAGVTTVLFNVNPLMKYDGYYLLCDLLEIPNLRLRATRLLQAYLKRWALGANVSIEESGASLRGILVSYGVAAALYRTALLLGIAALIAAAIPLVGAVLAAGYLASALLSTGRALSRYVLDSAELASVRLRAALVSGGALLAAPTLLLAWPLSWPVSAGGYVRFESQQLVCASAPGFLEAIHQLASSEVQRGQPLATLRNDTLDEQVLVAQTELAAAQARSAAYAASDPARAQQEAAQLASLQAQLDAALTARESLRLCAPTDGWLVSSALPRELGRFVQTGEPLATLVGGRQLLRVQLSTHDFVAASPTAGARVSLRIEGANDTPLTARVARIRPCATRALDVNLPFAERGGQIALDPLSGRAAQAYVEVDLEIDLPQGRQLPLHARGRARFTARPDALAVHLYRAALRFLNRNES